MINVFVNGDSISINKQQLNQLLNTFNLINEGIAVAVNESVIPRSEWIHLQLQDGDHIIIITATQGG